MPANKKNNNETLQDDVLSVSDINKSDELESRDNISVNKKVPFAIVEAYKAIRANVSFLLSQNTGNVITVTSANAGEGKSTTSSNLAVAFSQLDKKVILVDADLRKASLHKKFKIKNGTGLSNILSEGVGTDGCIKEINPNLFLLTAGSIPPNPSELLVSKKFDETIELLSKNYDLVIIDTPPLNVVSDALIVAPKTTGVILVVRDGYTPLYSIQKAIDVMKFSHINILGAVMNGANPGAKNKYIYRKYSYKYHYGGYNYGYGNYGYGYGYGVNNMGINPNIPNNMNNQK